MQQVIDEFKQLDGYGRFFLVTGFTLMSLLMGAAGLAVFHSTEHGNPLIIYPIATLFATVVMLNLGNNSASAKEVFWGWIVVTFGFAAWALFGVGLMMLLKLVV